MGYFIFLLFLRVVLGVELKINGQCRTDQDCLSFTLRLNHLPPGSTTISTRGYACLQGQCSYIVNQGSICRQASDCSQYAFLSNAIRNNQTDMFPTGYTSSNITQYISELCAPQFCTIASTCERNFFPFYQDPAFRLEPEKCCAGIQDLEPCALPGALVSTCKREDLCEPSADITSSKMICVKGAPRASTQYIGIILTLIAAFLTNLGLNLQKLALRKRHEKKVKRKETERIGLFFRLANLKLSVSNLYRTVSNTSLPRFPNNNGRSEKDDNIRVISNVEHNENRKSLTPGHSTPSSVQTIHPDMPDMERQPKTHIKSMSAGDKDKFQSKLGAANLAKNPRWWLGFIIFVIANFFNFAALNFAAQSLIGPLGSFSLVVNVVLAPMLNGEIWTWKDIIGVLLIVAGSVIVVVFSGANEDPGYNACVLLKLFSKTETIIFLVFTLSMILFIFLYIIILEKNLDFKEASAVVITETIESGELVAVETNPQSHGETESNDGKVIRRRPASRATGTSKRVSMVVSEQIADDGSNLRIVTITPDGRHMRKSSGPVSAPDVALAVNPLLDGVGLADRSGSLDKDLVSPLSAGKPRKQSVVPLTDEDGNTIQEIFTKKNDDGESVHSVALTFKLRQKPRVSLDDIEPDDFESLAADKDYMVSPNGETVVVLPKTRKELKRSTWANGIIEKLHSIPLISKILNVKLIPRFKNKIPLDSRLVRWALPFAYASLGGLMATLLTLFAKATIFLLTESFTGENQFNAFPAYLFSFMTLFAAISQVYWINLGLARYDALLQIPVFYVVLTLFDVIGGGVYYGEFKGFTAAKYGFFSLGVGVIFIGVAILATRLASLAAEDDDSNEDNSPVPDPLQRDSESI